VKCGDSDHAETLLSSLVPILPSLCLQVQLADGSTLRVLGSTFVEGHSATVLFDTGAAPNAVSAQFVEEHKFPVEPSVCQRVQLADGAFAPVPGFVFLDLEIQGTRFPRVPCLVVALSLERTLLLGEQFLKATRASLDFQYSAIRGYTRKFKPFVLRCALDREPLRGSSCDLLEIFLRNTYHFRVTGHSP
jgi:Aspartyl protease